jgi:hypothetical protein
VADPLLLSFLSYLKLVRGMEATLPYTKNEASFTRVEKDREIDYSYTTILSGTVTQLLGEVYHVRGIEPQLDRCHTSCRNKPTQQLFKAADFFVLMYHGHDSLLSFVFKHVPS